MTTITIDDSSPQGKWLLDLIKGHKSVINIESKETKKSFREACIDCNAVPLDAFIGELKVRIEKWPDNA